MAGNPQKILDGRYQVVPRTIIFIFKDDLVLLQKASETKKIYPGSYNGIGGHIERGEDLIAGARRELREETGLTCENLRFAGSIVIDVQNDRGILLFIFTGEDVQGELTSSEEGSLHWVPISKLPEMNVVEDIPELVTRVLNYRTENKLFYGKYFYDEAGKRFASWITEP